MQPVHVLMIGGSLLALWGLLQFGVEPIGRAIAAAQRRPGPANTTPQPAPDSPQFGTDAAPPPGVVEWWNHMRSAGGSVEFTAECVAGGLTLAQAMQRRLDEIDAAPDHKSKSKA